MDEKLLNLEVGVKTVMKMTDEEKETALAITDYDEFVEFISELENKYEEK